jgi:hypothetical protein
VKPVVGKRLQRFLEGMEDQTSEARQAAQNKDKATKAASKSAADKARKQTAAGQGGGGATDKKSKTSTSEITNKKKSASSTETSAGTTTTSNETSSLTITKNATSSTEITTTDGGGAAAPVPGGMAGKDQSGIGGVAKKRKRGPSKAKAQEMSETAKRARLPQAKDSDNVKGDDFGCEHLGIKQMITKRICTTSEFNFHSQEGHILHDNTCKGCKKPTANIDKEKRCPISKWYICYCEIGHTFRDDDDGLTCRIVFCYTCAMVQVKKRDAAAGGGGRPRRGGSG